MLNIENFTNVQLDYQLLEKISEKLTQKEIDLNICYNQTIQKYNALYRGKDSPTDVLSFPLENEIESGAISMPLGSIMISIEYVKNISKELGHSNIKSVVY